MSTRDAKSILIVDDEEPVRTMLRQILVMNGHRVLEARFNSEAFLRSLQYDHHIDLMVADVLMPGASGHELAEKLSALRPDMKVLYISGGPLDAVRDRLGDGNEPFLPKPFGTQDLLKKVSELLETYPRPSKTTKKKPRRKTAA